MWKFKQLSAKPDSRKDILIEEYEYCGYPINVYQNAHTVGADIPTYFGAVTKLHTKSKHGAIIDNSESIEVVKNCAEEYVDKLMSRRKNWCPFLAPAPSGFVLTQALKQSDRFVALPKSLDHFES